MKRIETTHNQESKKLKNTPGVNTPILKKSVIDNQSETKKTVQTDFLQEVSTIIHHTRNAEQDGHLYKIDQNRFESESKKIINELTNDISVPDILPSNFDIILNKIKTKRSNLLIEGTIKIRTENYLFTRLTPYYKERMLVAFDNMQQEYEKKTLVENIYSDIDMCKSNIYQKFTPVYVKNHKIKLTTTYWSHGKKLPVPSLKYSVGYSNIEYNAIVLKNPHKNDICDDPQLLSEQIQKQKNNILDKYQEYLIHGIPEDLGTELTEKIETFKKEKNGIISDTDKLFLIGFDNRYIDNKTSNVCIKYTNGTIMDCGLLHLHGTKVQENLNEIDKEYQEYKQNSNKNFKEAFENICNIVYLFAHTCPFNRGSAWSSEVIASAFLKDLLKNDSINFIRSDLDFQCFSQSSDNFINYIKKTLPLNKTQIKSLR
jgi:hypothetical protein